MDGRLNFAVLALLCSWALSTLDVERAGAAVPLPVPRPDMASDAAPPPAGPVETATPPVAPPSPATIAEAPQSFRAAVRAMIEREVAGTSLPADVADAVVRVESSYNPTTIGAVGEIGLMQIRPATAAMLGFKGNVEELARPDTNIHYGVIYLGKAWRLANGDLCRALMKYRAGHGEEVMSPRSVTYCNRAQTYLAALKSPAALPASAASVLAERAASDAASNPVMAALPETISTDPTSVYARFKQGTPQSSRAFWAVHELRIQTIKARIKAKWRRVASR